MKFMLLERGLFPIKLANGSGHCSQIRIYQIPEIYLEEFEKKSSWAETVSLNPLGLKILPGDQAYLDITGMSAAEVKKAILVVKKYSPSFWGIYDPKGAAEDPGAFFFDGARRCDNGCVFLFADCIGRVFVHSDDF